MLEGLWTIGIKVPDLERELEFQRKMGSEIVLDETLQSKGRNFRLPLIRMGDKYQHVGEEMVYEQFLERPLPYGIAHLVYRSSDFDADVQACLESGAKQIRDPVRVSAQFGERRVAFFRTPSGWIFEIIEILINRVPEV